MDGGGSRTSLPNVVHDSGVVYVCDHLCTRASTGERYTERLQGMLQRVHLFDMIIARNPLLAEIHPGLEYQCGRTKHAIPSYIRRLRRNPGEFHSKMLSEVRQFLLGYIGGYVPNLELFTKATPL